jgi:hypothetical protein
MLKVSDVDEGGGDTATDPAVCAREMRRSHVEGAAAASVSLRLTAMVSTVTMNCDASGSISDL